MLLFSLVIWYDANKKYRDEDVMSVKVLEKVDRFQNEIKVLRPFEG